MDDLEDAGQRYAYLLKPVKDLAANWSIDIASQLEQYVENLRKELLAREKEDEQGSQQRKNFNFAEAAVLISGSTTVYGRKVDYVHQAAMGFCSQLEETKQKKKGKGDGEDEGGEDGANSDGENEPQESALDPFTFINFDNLKWCEDSVLMMKNRPKPLQLLPVVPMAMMQLADFEKTNVPFYNKANKNEIVNKKDDFKINTCFILSEGVALLDLKNIDFINKFSVMISDDVLDIKKEPPDSRPGTAVHQDGLGAVTLNLTDGVTLKQPELESNNSIPMGDIEQQPQPVESDENMVNLPGSGENISKIPGSQSPDGNKTNLFNRPSSRIETMRRETRSMYETFRPSGVDVLTDRQRSFDIFSGRRKSAAAAFHLASERESESFVGGGFAGDDDFMEVQENQENIPSRPLERTAWEIQNLPPPQPSLPEDNDAWLAQLEELDPYEEVPYKNRPLKVNKKCYNYAIDQVKRRDRKIQQECRALGKTYFPSVKDFIHFNLYRRKLKKKAHVLAQFQSFLCDRGLLALNPILYEEEKRRTKIRREREIEAKRLAAEQRRSRSRTPRQQTPVVDDDVELGVEEDYGKIMEELIKENDDQQGNKADNENENIEPDDAGFNDLLQDGDLNQSIVGGYLYIQDLEGNNASRRSKRRSKKVLDPDELAADAEVAAAFENDEYGITDLPPRPISQMSYEELVTYHLRKYWSIAEESRSKFCERVEKWEEKMIPLLEEEATRPEFSIHTYGTEILEKYGEDGVGKVKTFKDMVKGVHKFEISRYFLSSLLLANTRNLEIQSSSQNPKENDDEEMVINTMRMKLLGMERHHKLFEDEQRLLTGAPPPK